MQARLILAHLLVYDAEKNLQNVYLRQMSTEWFDPVADHVVDACLCFIL